MRYRTCKLKPLEKTGFWEKCKVLTPPLNNFVHFFSLVHFSTFSKFCDLFKRLYSTIRFSKQFENRKYGKK